MVDMAGDVCWYSWQSIYLALLLGDPNGKSFYFSFHGLPGLRRDGVTTTAGSALAVCRQLGSYGLVGGGRQSARPQLRQLPSCLR